MRFPRHLSTGDNLNGLLSISCVCEGHGASTRSDGRKGELSWGSGSLRLSHTAHRACVPVAAWSEDHKGMMAWGEGGILYPLETRGFVPLMCQVPPWFSAPSWASTMCLHFKAVVD